MTVTVTVQLLLAAIAPLLRLTVFPPPVAEADPPVQVVLALGVAAFTTPLGYVSVKATLEMPLELGFVTVIVSVDVPPSAITSDENSLVTVGGAMTVNVALVEFEFDNSCVVVRSPTAMVFSCEPPVEDVTVTVIVQLPLAGIVPPLMFTEPAPATAVTDPPLHVVVPLGVLAFTTPAG